MKDRPAMETMVKRYEAMQADVFDSLEEEFGAKPWEVSPEQPGRRTLRLRWARATPRARRSTCRR